MKQPSNTISSNTAPSHYLSSTPKPPTPHHHPFPVQLPLTGKSPTSTPATQATSQTFYDKAAFYPAHSTLPTILAFCSGRSHYPQPKPRPRRVCSHYPQHLATPQEHPLPHHYAPSMGRRHKIHFWRRRAGHDPSERLPRSRLSPERQLLGHPPRPCNLSTDWHGPSTPLHQTYDISTSHNHHFQLLFHPATLSTSSTAAKTTLAFAKRLQVWILL